MNRDLIEGCLKQAAGRLRAAWGDLTESEVHCVEGRRTEMIGQVLARQGRARAEAVRELGEWVRPF